MRNAMPARRSLLLGDATVARPIAASCGVRRTFFVHPQLNFFVHGMGGAQDTSPSKDRRGTADPFISTTGIPMSFARRTLLASLALTLLAGASALYSPANAQARKEIVFGATAGPYADQIKLGIKPLLEAKGYRVKVVEFNDYIRPNFALAQGDIDANAFQHVVYLNRFAAENKLALSELLKVPTAPIAVYSHKHKSLAEVKEGATVALPNDPTNAARALVVLEQLGWIRLRTGYDPIRASESDVALNIKRIKLLPLEAAQLPRSLDDTDFSFVNGNFALASGLKLTDALALEKTSPTYQNLVAIRTVDKNAPWVRDIAEAYRSREFLALTETRFAGFVKTDYQQALLASGSK